MSNLQSTSIQFIKGVGPARKKLFENLGVATVEDLLYLFPRRYEDRRTMTPIGQLKIGEFQTAQGLIQGRLARRAWYTKKHLTEITLEDGKARIFCVWFNQPYLERYFIAGKRVVVYGKVELYKDRLQMVSPEYEIIDDDEGNENLSIGRIVPIYPLTRGMTERYLRKVIRAALDKYLDQVPDILPVWLRNKHRLANIRRSLANIHFPEKLETQELAMRRVFFEEFFLFQLSVLKRRLSLVTKPGVAHTISADLIETFEGSFPFSLTRAQRRVIREIAMDMQRQSPMLRLLQGDVGSGKTLVALFGCIAAFKSGCQAAIMAPTEILARQHFENIQEILAKSAFRDLRLALFVSHLSKKEREATLADLAAGKIDVVVGTHALLTEAVTLPRLSFVVVDEQHKFGVKQRALLSGKGTSPDVLVMTATPIPRTLSLTLFGDLDVSTLDEMPPGKGKVTTKLFTSDQAPEVYQAVRRRVEDQKQQVYIVYPIIEESEKSRRFLNNINGSRDPDFAQGANVGTGLKAAEAMFKHFQSHEFKGLRLGLIHGQMKKAAAQAIMKKFKNRNIDILVATTILEVGVDVPSAGVMVIEHAERFGLSQLHQLRGRVGRGGEDGVCFLIADTTTEDSVKRLEAIVATTDGFKIAETDLLIRGPGHYFGRHQHGINELKFANPVLQMDILELARKEAEELIHQDPGLAAAENRILEETIRKRYPTYLEMVEAG